jgi:hypothetical protein
MRQVYCGLLVLILAGFGCAVDRPPEPGSVAMVGRENGRNTIFARDPDGWIEGLQPGTLVRIVGPVGEEEDTHAAEQTRVLVLGGVHAEKVGRVDTRDLHPLK